MKLSGLLIVLAFLFSGCNTIFTHTVYHQPESAEKRVCTSQCFYAQKQCKNQKDAQHKECENQHRYAMESYRECKDAGGKDCRQPPSCSYKSYSTCEEDYKACFSECGGWFEEVPGL